MSTIRGRESHSQCAAAQFYLIYPQRLKGPILSYFTPSIRRPARPFSPLFSSLILFMQIAQMEFPQEAELEGRQRGGRRRRGIPGRCRGGERSQPCAVAVSGGAAAQETFPVSGRGGTGGYFVNLYSFTPSVLLYRSKCNASLHSTGHGLNVKATICCMDPPKMSPHECAEESHESLEEIPLSHQSDNNSYSPVPTTTTEDGESVTLSPCFSNPQLSSLSRQASRSNLSFHSKLNVPGTR